jgi:hypothetical protein
MIEVQTKPKFNHVYMLYMICKPDRDYVWRVSFDPTGFVACNYIGFIPIDIERSVEYSTFDKLPEWIKNSVAVLRLLPPNPVDSVLFNVGRRTDDTTYWVVQPYETVGVDDPRGENKEEGSCPA